MDCWSSLKTCHFSPPWNFPEKTNSSRLKIGRFKAPKGTESGLPTIPFSGATLLVVSGRVYIEFVPLFS